VVVAQDTGLPILSKIGLFGIVCKEREGVAAGLVNVGEVLRQSRSPARRVDAGGPSKIWRHGKYKNRSRRPQNDEKPVATDWNHHNADSGSFPNIEEGCSFCDKMQAEHPKARGRSSHCAVSGAEEST
jgi:hypothetical protein